jgi:hypothetical protein
MTDKIIDVRINIVNPNILTQLKGVGKDGTVDIKAKFTLVGEDLTLLKNMIAKGITIPVRFSGVKEGLENIGGSVVGGGSKGGSSRSAKTTAVGQKIKLLNALVNKQIAEVSAKINQLPNVNLGTVGSFYAAGQNLQKQANASRNAASAAQVQQQIAAVSKIINSLPNITTSTKGADVQQQTNALNQAISNLPNVRLNTPGSSQAIANMKMAELKRGAMQAQVAAQQARVNALISGLPNVNFTSGAFARSAVQQQTNNVNQAIQGLPNVNFTGNALTRAAVQQQINSVSQSINQPRTGGNLRGVNFPANFGTSSPSNLGPFSPYNPNIVNIPSYGGSNHPIGPGAPGGPNNPFGPNGPKPPNGPGRNFPGNTGPLYSKLFNPNAANALFRKNYQHEEFLKDYDKSVFSRLAFGDDAALKQSAYRNNVDIGAATKATAGRKLSLFDPKNRILKDPEAGKAVLFAGLLGGPGAGIGASLGASIFGGSGGALAGAGVFAAVSAGIGGVVEAMKGFAAQGLEFQRSIIGIGAALGATTQVSVGGKNLSQAAQVGVDIKRAREIQNKARELLLPLGVGGETEAAIVQSTFSGAAQRGFALSADQTAKVSEAFGAAIQTLAPELASNPTRIRKDIEDIIVGSPRAATTSLGVRLKGFAPELFTQGGPKSAEELTKVAERLSVLTTAFKNSGEAAASLAQVQGRLNILTTNLGDSFLQGLAPSLDVVNELLQDKGLEETFKNAGKAIGEFTGGLIQLTAAAGAGVAKVITLYSALGNITNPEKFGNLIQSSGFLDFIPGVKEGREKRLADAATKKANSSEQRRVRDDIKLDNTLSRFGLGTRDELISAAEKAANDSPEVTLAGISVAKENPALGVKEREGLTQKKIGALNNLLSEMSKTFDTQTLAGEREFLGYKLGNNSERQSEIQKIISEKFDEKIGLQKQAQDIAKNNDFSQQEKDDALEKIREKIIKSTAEAAAAERQLAAARTEAAQTARQLAVNAVKTQLADVDTETIKGGLEGSKLQREIAVLEGNLTSRVASIQDNRADERAGVDTFSTMKNLQSVFEGTVDTIRQTNRGFADLNESVRQTTRTIADFREDTKLRQLGREGNIIADAKAALAAGASESDLSPQARLLLAREPEITKKSALEKLRVSERDNQLPRVLADEKAFEEGAQRQLQALGDEIAAGQRKIRDALDVLSISIIQAAHKFDESDNTINGRIVPRPSSTGNKTLDDLIQYKNQALNDLSNRVKGQQSPFALANPTSLGDFAGAAGGFPLAAGPLGGIAPAVVGGVNATGSAVRATTTAAAKDPATVTAITAMGDKIQQALDKNKEANSPPLSKLTKQDLTDAFTIGFVQGANLVF